MEKMNRNRNGKLVLLAAIIAVAAVSALFTNATFVAVANAGSLAVAQRAASYRASPLGGPWAGPRGMGDGGGPMSPWAADLPADGFGLEMARWAPARWGRGRPGNVSIDSAQAKATVEAVIPSLRVGTVASLRTGWLVPIEDGKGVVASIQVSNVAASTAEQAKAIVEESLRKGWKAGEPRLAGAIYAVPLLDSKDSIVAIVRVDGRSGEIIRRPSTIMAVTAEQARAMANDAIREFKVGEARDRGGSWMVRIEYRGKAVMAVVLGKLNTPSAEDAVKAVQDSLGRGWSAGEPKQLRSAYRVPILDSKGNAIGGIGIDGRTGEVMGIPLPK
jgi:hypothetical protein